MNDTPQITVAERREESLFIRRFVRAGNFWIMIGHRMSLMSDKIAMGPYESRVYLHRRVAMAEVAANRSHHALGRLLNWATGVDAESVTLTGPVLQVVLRSLGRELPEDFHRKLDYRVALDLARELRDEMASRRIGEFAA